ncbi:odorant receptor 98a-like [Drosophila tropicalis]|uniref:odorant receptor 98a-like n=1 Tax=Drosophila tropicalis TaxID=46794 RepID=UPI0035ABFE1D
MVKNIVSLIDYYTLLINIKPLEKKIIFNLLRKPRPQDMKSTADAFAYFQYGMTGVGFLPPSKGRKLYMMFRGLVIICATSACRMLVECIAQHNLILEYSDLMRSLFSLTTFIQFLLIGTLLGCTLVNQFFFSDFWNGLSCVIFIIILMSQTFPFCYICDLIVKDCDRLALAIFHTNWIGSSRRYKSTIVQFIQKAQKPIAFKAGSIFPICMQTNIQVAKLAFSVVTFVQQLNIADKFLKK